MDDDVWDDSWLEMEYEDRFIADTDFIDGPYNGYEPDDEEIDEATDLEERF